MCLAKQRSLCSVVDAKGCATLLTLVILSFGWVIINDKILKRDKNTMEKERLP